MTQAQVMKARPAASARGMRWMVAGMVLAVTATVAVSAWAQPMGGGHGKAHGGMMFEGSSERAGRGMDRMLNGLGATEAQRAQIRQIMQAAATDMKAQREAMRALHDKSRQIFTAPTVDAAAAESVRQQLQVKHDEMSRRRLQAMLDASNVLTPEQRAKLGEHMALRAKHRLERGSMMERHRSN